MNKTIINIFTYLVIFLAITQIINYLYNEIYGSLIFFLILSTGLYFITKKNVPISLLLTIVITNILNVSDVLDNNLYEGRRDRRRRRQANNKTNKAAAQEAAKLQKEKNIQQAEINSINVKIADRESELALYSEKIIEHKEKRDNFLKKMDVKENNFRSLRDVDQGELKNLNITLNDSQKTYDDLEGEIRSLRDKLADAGYIEPSSSIGERPPPQPPPTESTVFNPY
tara:strand:- start:2596 stop:3276 length:681 start_codon:yes stop_codon:yes gene_type:complete